MNDWIKGRQQDDPTLPPRIDWWRTLSPFIPFWLLMTAITIILVWLLT